MYWNVELSEVGDDLWRSQQIVIASDDHVGSAHDGSLDHNIIVRITAEPQDAGRHDDFGPNSHEGEQFFDVPGLDLVAAYKPWSIQDEPQFGQQWLAGHQFEVASC